MHFLFFRKGSALILVFLPLTAHAIPPPDLLVTVWQSALMGLGMGIAFLSVGWSLCRNWIRCHTPVKLRIALVTSLCALMGSWLWIDPRPEAVEGIRPKNHWGEMYTIDEIIAKEPIPHTRAFKIRIYREMRNVLEVFRKAKNLPVPEFTPIRSIHPQELQTALIQRRNELWLLDVRDPIEQQHLRIPMDQWMSYGDIANQVDGHFPADKTVVVYCHSGLRGYIAASLLRTAGVPDVVFLRDGLQEWIDLKLPFEGGNDFPFLVQNYSEFPYSAAEDPGIKKIDFTFNGGGTKIFPNSAPLYYELSTTEEIITLMSSLERQPVLLITQTESEQYDAACFAKRYESRGGKVLGYIPFSP